MKKLQMTLLLALMTLVCSCGSTRYIHPDFQTSYDEFLQECTARGIWECQVRAKELDSVDWGNLEGLWGINQTRGFKIHGQIAYNTHNEIYIDTQLRDGPFKPVLFHELAHALLRMKHHREGTCLMPAETSLTKLYWALSNWDFCVKELFEEYQKTR